MWLAANCNVQASLKTERQRLWSNEWTNSSRRYSYQTKQTVTFTTFDKTRSHKRLSIQIISRGQCMKCSLKVETTFHLLCRWPLLIQTRHQCSLRYVNDKGTYIIQHIELRRIGQFAKRGNIELDWSNWCKMTPNPKKWNNWSIDFIRHSALRQTKKDKLNTM